MAEIDQVVAQVRFQLEQLSVQNAHHTFEHLCRYLTRARICSNILPATGPVSAGGDQGRDFESFRTYLQNTTISNSVFVGLASDRPIAFACTLQRERIERKVKNDVETITGSGTSVIDIHYFCSTDVNVAVRHELQRWAREERGVHLEIHDGLAIAELLAAPDVFWIAVRFLSIPAEIFPTAPVDRVKEWYVGLRTVWADSTDPPINYSDFADIKEATRYSTKNEYVRTDLPFWISLLERLHAATHIARLRRRATYEISVASLRGLGTLDEREDELRKYFRSLPEIDELSDFEDAAVLLNYCLGARYRNIVGIDLEEIDTWRGDLIRLVEDALGSTSSSGARCKLWEIRGYLHMSPGPRPDAEPNVESTIKCWMEVAHLVEQAPLFPLEAFADHLVKYIDFIGDHPLYGELTERVDELLATRHGEAIAAEKCRDRAMAFYRRGDIIRAVSQLHNTKVKWYADETLRGSLLSMLMLSRWYQEMGLAFAAKYYSLAPAYIAVQNTEPEVKALVPSALVEAAECDYCQGAWFSFLTLTESALGAYALFKHDRHADDWDSELYRTVFHTTLLRTIVRRISPELFPAIEERIRRWGMDEFFDDLIPLAEEAWGDRDINELWHALEEQMLDRPLSDLGAVRHARFEALGIRWEFSWENAYDVTAAAEQLLAVLQITLVDFASLDLRLLSRLLKNSGTGLVWRAGRC